MRTFTNFLLGQSQKTRGKGRFWVLFAFLLFFCTSAFSQNVTISPSSGKLVAGLTYAGEVGFTNGWSSLWRHNQLPLTLTVSDQGALSEGGQLLDPAGNISLDTAQDLYVVMGGTTVTTHMNISLPKGFRFTGYRIVLLNNVNGKTVNSMAITGMSKTLYETDGTFNVATSKAKTPTMNGTNSTTEFVIERTSKTETDMTNNLYFYFQHATNGYYGATIKSCELFFTAEGAFEADVAPGTPGNIVSEGVNIVGSPFSTSKLDLGQIKPNEKAGVIYYSYNFEDVKELTANNMLYQADAVTADKKLPETPGSGSIQALKNGDNFYYALGNNTYYIETPTSTTTQDGVTIPLGYRITGAKIKAYYGTEQAASTIDYDEELGGYYISQEYDGKTYYLNTEGAWDLYPVSWKRNPAGMIYSGTRYLHVYMSNSRYYVNVVSNPQSNNNYQFTINGSTVQWGTRTLTYDGAYSRLVSSPTTPASWTPASTPQSVENPAFKPSPFTLKVYAANGETVADEQLIDDSHEAVVELTELNNDAVKFSIEGLEEGTKALVTFCLKLEALNPFINSMDIVCESNKDGQKLFQQFTSNDFQVSGGAFVFYVPTDFLGEGYNTCKFSFQNLMSKYMDSTYGNGTNGNARNFFVKSDYYNDFGDGHQYETTGNEGPDYSKISTAECGDIPFKYSNIDELDPNNTSGGVTNLKEYPYSEALYIEQGGTFTTDIELSEGQSKDCYLFTADETRWNIAPTTALEHRYFAYYLMALTLTIKDYDAKCELTPIYETTFYQENGEDKELPMYGGVFKAYDKETHEEIPSTMAYLTVNMMKQALIDALYGNEATGVTGVGATGKQVLYLDYTNLYSVQVVEAEEMQAMKDKLNPNCLIYFPERTSYNEDNYIQKTKSGNFRACKNIVITDKQPFYAPYTITVPAENYATYSREITVPQNGKVVNATVMLPFTLELTDGEHTNRDGGCSFKVHKMEPDNCFAVEHEVVGKPMNYHGKAHFAIHPEPRTEANVPYMVKVETAPTADHICFMATQYGSDVIATRGSAMDPTAYTFEGETASGKIKGESFVFKNYGSYSGKKLDKTGNIFYFSGNMFLNSQNLRAEFPYVYMYPFRAYYVYEGSASGSKMLYSFSASSDGSGEATGITELENRPDLAVSAGQGSITITSTKDRHINVIATNGMNAASVNVKAGDSTTVHVPAGLYIVNGVKIIVK